MKKIITICLITITFVLTGCSNREYNVTCTKDFTTKISKEEMIEKIKRETRRYAKRQMTWFRKNKQTIWIEPQDIEKILNEI